MRPELPSMSASEIFSSDSSENAPSRARTSMALSFAPQQAIA
jgi:hypothetical protein